MLMDDNNIKINNKVRKRRSGLKYNTSRKYEKMRSDANEKLAKQRGENMKELPTFVYDD